MKSQMHVSFTVTIQSHIFGAYLYSAGHEILEPASVGCDDRQGELFYPADPQETALTKTIDIEDTKRGDGSKKMKVNGAAR